MEKQQGTHMLHEYFFSNSRSLFPFNLLNVMIVEFVDTRLDGVGRNEVNEGRRGGAPDLPNYKYLSLLETLTQHEKHISSPANDSLVFCSALSNLSDDSD